ncbi:hypothetical protein [Methylocapsa palsarum]|uniref:Uncharacterized protein n=1 Tax=Methylocapsa palsarum TaxID=1612308 RepID=A0A1I4BR80_9HYPH|nr:hypothetical protein [Methylocapsa palsarum]SFK71342.1 hypothetical protein SAMN05444581_11636 [Methylocapsa palsarum]
MISDRHGPAFKRGAIVVVAAYAFALQALIGAAASPMDQKPAQGVLCGVNSNSPESPGRPHSGHGLCCILASVFCAHIFSGAEQATVASPPRVASNLAWLARGRFGAVSRVSASFLARGPPESL